MTPPDSTPKDFMPRAIARSREALSPPGAAPFGAVVVKDGRVVGEGMNRVVAGHDPTSHGEVEAIRDAGRRLGTWNLSGCELYTSCEPCELCVAAMFWAKIDKMYYAATLDDCGEIGLDCKPLRETVRRDLEDRPLTCEPLMNAEGRAVLLDWAKSPDFDPFQ